MKRLNLLIITLITLVMATGSLAGAQERSTAEAVRTLDGLDAAAVTLASAGNARQGRDLREVVAVLRSQFEADSTLRQEAVDDLAALSGKFTSAAGMWARTSPPRAEALRKAARAVAGAVELLKPLIQAAPAASEAAGKPAGSAAASGDSEAVIVYIASPAEAALASLAGQLAGAIEQAQTAPAAPDPVAPQSSPGVMTESDYLRMMGDSAQATPAAPASKSAAAAAGASRASNVAGDAVIDVRVRLAGEETALGSIGQLRGFIEKNLARMETLPVIFSVADATPWASVAEVVNVFSASALRGGFSFAGLTPRAHVAAGSRPSADGASLPLIPAGPLPEDLRR